MIKNALTKRLIISAALLFGFMATTVAATPAYAAIGNGAKKQACAGANLSNTDDDCDSSGAESTAESTIKNIINLLTVIVGIAAIIIIIVNGLRFITANGDSGSITSARNGIIYALVGLLVAGFAQVIVRFVLDRI